MSKGHWWRVYPKVLNNKEATKWMNKASITIEAMHKANRERLAKVSTQGIHRGPDHEH